MTDVKGVGVLLEAISVSGLRVACVGFEEESNWRTAFCPPQLSLGINGRW